MFYDKAKRTQQGNLLGIIPAWASDDSVGTEPPRGPDTLLHIYLVHWWKVMKHNLMQDRTYIGFWFVYLFFCAFVFVVCFLCDLVGLLYWFWLLLLLHNLLYAAWVSSYSSEDNNEVITQISRYFLLDYWSTMWKTSALHLRLKYFWWLLLISNENIARIANAVQVTIWL